MAKARRRALLLAILHHDTAGNFANGDMVLWSPLFTTKLTKVKMSVDGRNREH